MRLRIRTVALLVLAVSPQVQAQSLPHLTLASFPEISRQAIAPVYNAAVAHPDDAALVGRLGMMLHAWEQFETASAVYARARMLERRFDWFYLGGLVEARLAHHDAAARLLAEATQLMPAAIPARLALADALFESGDIAGARREYSALTMGPAAPLARYGLGRSLAAAGQMDAARQELDAALRMSPEFGAAWYAEGMVLRGLGRLDEARTALERAQQYTGVRPALEDPTLARVRTLRDDADAHVAKGLS